MHTHSIIGVVGEGWERVCHSYSLHAWLPPSPLMFFLLLQLTQITAVTRIMVNTRRDVMVMISITKPPKLAKQLVTSGSPADVGKVEKYKKQ